jgi:molecular chaperone DnaK (HSP70)
VPIIARNTAIPVRKSEAFYTVVDDQPVVDVRIFQGENEDALENIKIGEFRIEGLSKAPAGNTVVLDLALDRDGILHVAAREKNTGLERRISIDQAVARYGAAELQQARERIDQLFGQDGEDTVIDEDEAGLDDAGVAALLDRASAKLDAAEDEDRQEMIDLMETIRDAHAAGDAATLELAQTQLSDLLFYLET